MIEFTVNIGGIQTLVNAVFMGACVIAAAIVLHGFLR